MTARFKAPKDYFIEGEKQLQQVISLIVESRSSLNERQETMKVQDAQLDSLSQTVRRLGEIGMTISDELTTQDRYKLLKHTRLLLYGTQR